MNKSKIYLQDFDKLIDIAKKTEYDWDIACQNKTYHLHNLAFYLKNTEINKSQTLFDMINDICKYHLSWIMDLIPYTNDDLPKEWIEFENTRNLLPSTFLQDSPNFQIINLNALKLNIWGLYENYEISFNLGDDGTDEMQESLEILATLISLRDKLLYDGLLTSLQTIAHLKIQEHLYDDPIYLYLDLQWAYTILRTCSELDSHDSKLDWLIDHLYTEHIGKLTPTLIS